MNSIVIYQAENGAASLSVRLDQETVWLTQEQIAELFGRERSVITKHLRNVFKEGELEESSVRAKFAHTAADGKEYQTQFYNLDVIISVGYRVRSQQGTRFRQWATQILRSHIVNGYTVNEQRLREESAKLQEMQRSMEQLARPARRSALDFPRQGGLLEPCLTPFIPASSSFPIFGGQTMRSQITSPQISDRTSKNMAVVITSTCTA